MANQSLRLQQWRLHRPLVFTVVPGPGVTLRWPEKEAARNAQLACSSLHSSQRYVVFPRLTRCVNLRGGLSSLWGAASVRGGAAFTDGVSHPPPAGLLVDELLEVKDLSAF